MIAKAKAISHGINDLRYITGESQHKKHPEKIYRVLDNLLPSEPDAMGVWNSMQLTLSQHRPIKNSVIRIELSPSPEHTQFYDIEDWQKLWQNFAEEFDKQVITGKDGKVRSCPTNLAGSKYTVWLHTEYKGEVPHLHAAVCRLDEDGNINNDHNIHLRAQHAAERVAKKRGWTTAAQIRISNVHQVNRDCMDTLKSMQSWSWEEYKNALIRKGYTVHEREDKKGILHGYALVNGNTKYKASELGVGRNLMISKLPSTWRKLHHQPATIIRNNTPQAIQQATEHKAVPIDYTQIALDVRILFPIPLPMKVRNTDSIFRKKCLTTSMTSLITGPFPTVRSLPIWLRLFLSDYLKRPALQPEAVAEVRKTTFRGETRTKMTCFGHADALVLPVVR